MDTASALGDGTEVRERWSLRLLGGFELRMLLDSQRVVSLGKRECALLAYLALSPNCRQARRKLATLLWGDTADEAASNSLRTSVWSVRRALGDAEHRFIASEGEDIVLDATAFDVDALAFRRLASQSGRVDLEAAANLYSGEFLDGVGIESEEFESWRRGETARSRDQAIDVLSRLMSLFAESGETERAIKAGARILSLEPLHEAAARRLMRLYGESGRRGAAVQLYRALADALRTELDAKPEAETRAVFAEIAHGGEERRNDPIATDASPPPAARQLALADGALRQAKMSKLNWILAGGLAAAMAIFLIYQLAPPASPANAISVAVLPFTNLSGDANQEFFSDGMTEEITAALSKVPNLRVVARTSAFQFKAQNQDLRVVGQELGTNHLIEGSVRRVGDRVRITAQLIKVDDGTHLWTETYDRQLTDIFAIQEDIAVAIAGALSVPLGLQQGDTLVSNRTIDPESYQQFLRARMILRNRGPQGSQQSTVQDRFAGAVAMLEQVVARDPGYAPAWALLAMMTSDPSKKEAAAREAIRLDPRNAAGYGALAQTEAFGLGNFARYEDLLRQALALDPNEPEVLNFLAAMLTSAGRIKEALSIRERLRTVEPFIPQYNNHIANVMLIDGQNEAAIAILEALPAASRFNVTLAHAYAAEERYGEAADTLLAAKEWNRIVGPQEDAARLLRSAPTKVKAPEALPVFRNELSYVYGYIGAQDRGLDDPERVIAEGKHLTLGQVRHIWSPEYAPIRKTERFKAFVRNAGYVDYWRARGWPDLCRPLGADDFACT
jgi:TolB-like protein/DNA-binding SARP family transcriptional activator/Flp pilus assembly protein TadD